MTGSFDDLELDELARNITQKWLAEAPPRTAFDQEDLAVAATLMSKGEVARLADLRPGERFFPQRLHRSAAIRTTTLVRFFCVPAKPGVYTSYAGWTIEAIEGRHKRTLFHSLNDAKAAFCIKELQERHHRTELLVTDTMKRAGITSGPLPGIWHDEPVRHERPAMMPPPSSKAPRPPAKPRQDRSKRFAMMEELRGFKR